MATTFRAKSVTGIWISAGFVIAMFLLLGTLAVLRLHRHQNAEIFLHRNSLADSALALLAPVAALARIVQARRDTAALKVPQA